MTAFKKLGVAVAFGLMGMLAAESALAQAQVPGGANAPQGNGGNPAGVNPNGGSPANPNSTNPGSTANPNGPGAANVANPNGGNAADPNLGGNYGEINQSPWFAHPDTQQHLGMTDAQYNALNRLYGNSYNQYNTGVNDLSVKLAPDERTARIQAMQNNFYNSLGNGVNTSITDPAVRTRFNQLGYQYRQFSAFNDPTVQSSLELTPAQRAQIADYEKKYTNQMRAWNQRYANDPEGTTQLYNRNRAYLKTQLNSVLTPEQQERWNNMTGPSYDFPASTYFGNGATTNTTLKPPSN